MNDKRLLLKNVGALGIIQIANFAMPLISVPIISRIVGPENYGVIQYAYAFVVYFNLFIGYGFNLTATRRLTQNPNDHEYRSRIFSEVLYCQIFLFIISIVILTIFIFTIPTLSHNKKIAIFSFIFCISSVFTQNWLFQAMQEMKKITILNLLGKLIYLIMVLSLVRSRDLYYWQPLSLSLTQIFIGFLSFKWAVKQYNLKIKIVKFKRILEILWQDRNVFFSLIFTSTYVSANIIVLGLLYSNDQVGYYTSAQKLIMVCLQVLAMPLSQVLFPYLGASYGKGEEQGIELTQKFMPLVLFISLILSIIILLTASPVLNIFYGKEFSNAIPVFRILAFVPFFSALSKMLGIQFMLNLKMDKEYFNAMAVATILSIILNYLLTFKYGFIGTAWAWLLTEVVICVFLYIQVERRNIKVFNPRFFKLNHIKSSIYSLKRK